MLLKRVITALIGIPFVLSLLWYGGTAFVALILAISLVGIAEMNRLWTAVDSKVSAPLTYGIGFLYVLVTYVTSIPIYNEYQGIGISFVTVLSIILSAVWLVLKYPNFKMNNLAATIFTPLFVAWLFSHLYYLRQLPSGFHFVLIVLIAIWCTDTFAYFVGINFGKHKLAPLLSPKKSVEGAVAGIVGSVLACLAIGYYYPQMGLIHYVIIGILVGVVGQIGDLTESALKRMAGVKDSGTLLPGHGGILDRFDSMFLTSPLVYYYLKLVVLSRG